MKKIGQYLITEEVLGQGEFSQVKIAFYIPTLSPVAMKIYGLPLTDTAQASLMAECHILQEIQSEYVVSICERYKSRHAFYLVMDYCSGGSLAAKIKGGFQISEETARRWSKQLIEQFITLRKQNIVHRDVKPANILEDEHPEPRCARICDFSQAREAYDGTVMTEQVGTAYYQAPEILKGGEYSFKVDVWSLGVTIAELLLGKCPFASARAYLDLVDQQKQTIFHYDSPISPLAQSFILSMLHYDPNIRPDFDQLRKHPFLHDLPMLEEDLDRSDVGCIVELQISEIIDLANTLITAQAKGIARTLVENCRKKYRRIQSMGRLYTAETADLERLWTELSREPEVSIATYQEAANTVLVQALVITADTPFISQAELRKAAALLDHVEQRSSYNLSEWLLPRRTLIRQLFKSR